MVTENHLLTPDDVAAQLKVHVNTVYKNLTEGKIAAVKIGNQWRIRQAEVDRIINEGIPAE